MKALVLYTFYADDLRLLALYLEDGIALERRFEFRPVEIGADIEEIKETQQKNPVFFGKLREVYLKQIDPEVLGKAIRDLIEYRGDEEALLALSKASIGK